LQAKLKIPKTFRIELLKDYDEPELRNSKNATIFGTTLMLGFWWGLSATLLLQPDPKPGAKQMTPMQSFLFIGGIGTAIAIIVILCNVMIKGTVSETDKDKWYPRARASYFFKDSDDNEYKYSATGEKVDRYFGLSPPV